MAIHIFVSALILSCNFAFGPCLVHDFCFSSFQAATLLLGQCFQPCSQFNDWWLFLSHVHYERMSLAQFLDQSFGSGPCSSPGDHHGFCSSPIFNCDFGSGLISRHKFGSSPLSDCGFSSNLILSCNISGGAIFAASLALAQSQSMFVALALIWVANLSLSYLGLLLCL